MGVGSTVVGAVKHNRYGLGCDVVPEYVNIAWERLHLLRAGLLKTRPMDRPVYRFAEEILQHEKHAQCWNEVIGAIGGAPLFIFPGKSKNKRLDVVQQLQNTYFDRKLAIESGWEFHPIATRIPNSNLTADFRKNFNGLEVQAEIQFGNMSRWYSDIFKFQAAYSESLTQAAISIVPMSSLATRIDSNVASFERAKRELPSANLSITLPILLIGVSADNNTPVID
ncbi:hypothetical protein KXV85_011358, partial [Aspergillus fumigatus]